MGLEHDGRLLLGIGEKHSRNCTSEIVKEEFMQLKHDHSE